MTMRKYIAVLALCGALSACSSSVPRSAGGIPAAAGAPIMLNVGVIEVSSTYVPPMKAPNIDHLIDPAPAVTVEALLRQRLQSQGGDRVLRVLIEDASVTSEPLPTVSGFWGVFSKEAERRYKGSVLVRFELAEAAAPDIIIGRAEVRADRTRSVMEGATLAEKDYAADGLVGELTSDVSNGLDDVVQRTFGGL